jgi:hypothetical protein
LWRTPLSVVLPGAELTLREWIEANYPGRLAA